MKAPDRRLFILRLAGAASAVAASSAMGQIPAPVSESDPTAAALGYKVDTTKVDSSKYPKHTPAQMCHNCQLYTGKPDAANGPCSIFGGKLVAAKGWCSAWVKKA